MPEDQSDVRLHVDTDWKAEAAKEKERLQFEEKMAAREGPAARLGPANFYELINVLVMQAAVALGGLQGPGGERIPPNAPGAKHFIDLLDVLAEKTKGNLTEEESRALERVLYELRMQYVQVFAPGPAPAPGHSAA